MFPSHVRPRMVIEAPVVIDGALVALYRKGKRIALAKATYEGLDRTRPREYDLSIPDFVDRDKEIV